MKQSILLLIILTLFSACKKSEDPTPSNPNNTKTNTPPTLQINLSYNATTNTLLQIDLSSKITDAQNDTWSIINVSTTHGTTSISNKIISYTSNAGYIGNDTITITIQDSKGASSTGKIAIVVSASTQTNHAPTFTSISVNVVSDGNAKIFTLPVSDSDGDNITITNITGNSSNISISRSGLDITVTPNNSVYAGVETLSIIISDGALTTTSDFTINIGSEPQIEAYNILSYFFDKPLDSDGIRCDCGHGRYTILSAGSITTTDTQYNGDFFEYATSEGTYNYTISSGGYITFTISTAASISYNPPQLTTIDGVKYLTLTKTNTSNCATYGNCAYTFWLH